MISSVLLLYEHPAPSALSQFAYNEMPMVIIRLQNCTSVRLDVIA